MAAEDHDGGTFVALDEASDRVVGPPAVLLMGFEQHEVPRVASLMRSIGARKHRIVLCTATMGTMTVGEALGGADDGPPLPAGKGLRVALLSGLTDGQIGQVLDGYTDTGLARPIFAVATDHNLGFTVVQLLEDLMAERQTMGGG